MNKKSIKVLHTLLLACVLAIVFCVPSFADDAITDILNQPRFGGAVTWVNRIGQLVDNAFMAVISFVSFFIISAACLRNVLAGAYCVFPKFWTAVHEAHTDVMGISISSAGSYFSGGGYKNASLGSISKFLLGLLPDIMVLTDFENQEDVDYKRYFMKAIPQCCCAVFVGVFIYNGLYRDVLSLSSRLGVSAITNFMTAVKPDVILEQLTNISLNVTYPVEGASTGTDRIADAYFKSVVGYVTTKYDDQYTRENKEKLYQALSDWSSEYCANMFGQFQDETVWDVQISRGGNSGASGFRTGPNTSQSPDQPYVSEDKLTYTYYVETPVEGEAGLTGKGMVTERTGQDCYVYAFVTFTNKGASSKVDAGAVNDVMLIVPLPVEGFPMDKGITFSAAGAGRLSISGRKQIGEAELEFATGTGGGSNAGDVTIKAVGNKVPNAGEVYTMSGASYQDNDGMNTAVRYIKFESGATGAKLSCCFEGDMNGQAGVTISYGDSLSNPVRTYQRAKSGSAVTQTTQAQQDEDEENEGLEDAD